MGSDQKGLIAIQGKYLVNSISLKEGEAQFLPHADVVNNLGPQQ